MKRKKLARQYRKKRIQRRFNPVSDIPPVTNQSPTNLLLEAYPISIYWDNDEDCFVAELNVFNDAQLHGSTWGEVAAAAKIAHRILIEVYRQFGYPLPEV